MFYICLINFKKMQNFFKDVPGGFQKSDLLGSYHFLGGGGDRLFGMAGRQFLVPPFACVKKYWYNKVVLCQLQRQLALWL